MICIVFMEKTMHLTQVKVQSISMTTQFKLFSSIFSQNSITGKGKNQFLTLRYNWNLDAGNTFVVLNLHLPQLKNSDVDKFQFSATETSVEIRLFLQPIVIRLSFHPIIFFLTTSFQPKICSFHKNWVKTVINEHSLGY